MKKLNVEVRDVGENISVLELSGDAGVDSIMRLRSAMDSSLAAGRVHLILNLRGVSYMDSAGFGALIGGLRRARALGGGLLLAAPDSAIRALMEQSRLHMVFPIFETEEQGLAFLAKVVG